MMKHLLTLIIILFIINHCNAQEDIVYVKWTPTSLLDPFAQSIQFSVEHCQNDKYSLLYSLGYIINSSVYDFYSDITGYRGRFGLRIYRNGLRASDSNFFHGPTFITRQMFLQGQQTICITPDCVTTQDVPYIDMQSKLGLTYAYGWHLLHEKHLSVELEILQGAAYVNNRKLGLTPLADMPNTMISSPTPILSLFNNGFRPSFHILIKIGFGIRSKQ